MNNFKSGGPGGLRGRKEFIGGRPKSDANYGPKKSFGDKPRFGGNDRGGNRGGDRKSFGNDGPREMFKATCATCGKACEVPFKPGGTKPVLCSECFGKNKSDDRGGRDRRDDRSQRGPQRSFDSAPRGERGESRGPSPDYKAFQKQVAELENKVNEMLEILKAQQKAVKVEKKAAKVTETVVEVPAKEKRVKKVAVKKVAAKKAVKKTK